MKKRKVYLVGAGPGKADLISVRGQNILKQADTVIYDYLVDRQLLEHAGKGAELISCDRLAKKGRCLDLIIKKAKQGKKVIRLKNGNPSIFGRSAQELAALAKAGIEFEIVPGITAACAASCLSGIPLTNRKFSSACVFVTGHEDPTKKESSIDWSAVAKSGTIVLYMAVGNLEHIIAGLLKAGKDETTACAIIQDVSLPRQKALTGRLKDIVKKAKRQEVRAPAIIIIGEVAKAQNGFNWWKKNRRTLFTGLSAERFFVNGTYLHLPMIRIEPMKSYKEFDGYLRNIKAFDWIVFASRYGVEYFFARLKGIGYDSRVLHGIKIAAIGNSTKERLLDFGVLADLVPRKESSQGLIKRFQKEDLAGKKIFLPRSDLSDKNLSKGLQKLTARVTTSFAYRNVMPRDLPDLDLESFNRIMFTSPSTVRNFKQRYRRLPKRVKIRCIGDVTLKEAKRCRLLD